MSAARFPLALLAAGFAFSLSGCAKKLAPEEAARTFVDLIAAGQSAKAYASATYAFREQQTLHFFQTALRELGLEGFTAVQYEPVDYSSSREVARVKATFTRKQGDPLPLMIAMVEDGGTWKILSLKSPRDRTTGEVENAFTLLGHDPRFDDPTTHQPPPPDKVCKALATDSLLGFSDAIQRKSFIDFFDQCALHWQDQLVTREGPSAMPGSMKKELTEKQRELGAARLQHAFQSFVEQNIDLSGIKAVEPVFDQEPWLNTEGLLVLSGYYPTQPYRVIFNLKFYYELPTWRLFGIDVNLKKMADSKS